MTYQGLFGLFPFTVSESEVCTFRDLQRSREAVYATHDTLSGTQKIQFTGINNDTFSMSVLIVPMEAVSTVGLRLRVLDALIESGEELPLVIGLRWYGQYVLKSYQVTHKIIHYGVTLSAQVSLNLLEYN